MTSNKETLRVGSKHRPNLTVIALSTGFIRLINNIRELSPDDARTIAKALNKAADHIEKEKQTTTESICSEENKKNC